MPRQVDAVERRAEIAYAVWKLMARGGIEAVRMRAVADEAQISVGRVQHYFATKEQMIRHGLEILVAAADDAYAAAVADLGEADELAWIIQHAVPRTEVERIGTVVWSAYVALGVNDPETLDIVSRTVGQGQDRVTELVASLRPDLDSSRAGREARRLLALGDGLAQRVLIGAITAAEAGELLTDELAAYRS